MRSRRKKKKLHRDLKKNEHHTYQILPSTEQPKFHLPTRLSLYLGWHKTAMDGS